MTRRGGGAGRRLFTASAVRRSGTIGIFGGGVGATGNGTGAFALQRRMGKTRVGVGGVVNALYVGVDHVEAKCHQAITRVEHSHVVYL